MRMRDEREKAKVIEGERKESGVREWCGRERGEHRREKEENRKIWGTEREETKMRERKGGKD